MYPQLQVLEGCRICVKSWVCHGARLQTWSCGVYDVEEEMRKILMPCWNVSVEIFMANVLENGMFYEVPCRVATGRALCKTVYMGSIRRMHCTLLAFVILLCWWSELAEA